MKKGLIVNEDTKLDILSQLSEKQRLKRASYMEKDEELKEDIKPEHPLNEQGDMNNDENNDSLTPTQEIELQVAELLKSQENMEEIDDENSEAQINEEKDEDIEYKPELTMDQLLKDYDQKTKDEETLSAYTREQLLEETQHLKIQLKSAQSEIADMNDDIDKNNRLLNIIIAILIIVLLGVIGIVVYWLISGGII